MSGRSKTKDEQPGIKEKDSKQNARNPPNLHYNNKQANSKRSKPHSRPGTASSGTASRQPTPNGVVALQKEKGVLPTDPIGGKPRSAKNNKHHIAQLAPKFTHSGNEGKTPTPERPKSVGKPPHQPSPKSNNLLPRQTGTPIDALLMPKTSNEKPHSSKPDVFQQLFPNGKPNGFQSNMRQKSDHAIRTPATIPVIPQSKSTGSVVRGSSATSQENTTKDKETKISSTSSAGSSLSSVSSKEDAQAGYKARSQRRSRNKKPKDKQAIEKAEVKKQSNHPAPANAENQKALAIMELVNKTLKLQVKEMPNDIQEVKTDKKAASGKQKTEEDGSNSKTVPDKPEEQKNDIPKKNEMRQDKPLVVDHNMEKLGLEQAAAKLNKDYIVLLGKKSQQFPNAKFICRLCNYHIDSVIQAHRHIKEKRHRKLFKEKKQDELLKGIAIPPPEAVECLQLLLTETVLKDSVLTAEDVKLRKSVVQKLDDIISKQMSGTRIVIYGSSLSGFGFKTSDINVDLQHPSTVRAPNALLRVLDILERSTGYKDVRADFRAKIPRIDFTDVSSSLNVRLSTNNEFAVTTTRLLMFYAALDERVLQLSMVFRSWAQLCKLDRQHEGSLPPYAFVLMAIFFMQKHKYLPVLHKVIAEHDMDEILAMSMNCPQLVRKGDTLWYIPSPPPTATKDSETATSPGRNNSEGTEDSDSESELDMTTADSAESPMESPQTSPGPLPDLPLKPISLLAECGGRDEGVALLWLKMIKFFALEYNIENLIISIKHSGDLKREDRNWGKKRIAVLDPYSTKRNLCRSMNSQNVFSFMMTRLKAAVLYFHGSSRNALNVSAAPVTQQTSLSVTSQSVEQPIEDLVAEIVRAIERGDGKLDTDAKSESVEAKDGPNVTYRYKFTRDVITEGNNPVVVCGLCKKEGHVREKCPDEVHTYKLAPIPAMTPELRDMLDRVSWAVMEQYIPTVEELNHRQQICTGLTRYLQFSYDSHTQMTLFGSSKNGFGFRGSDLDICMTFDNHSTGEELDFVSIIEGVARCLRRCQELRGILPITTAKVPIVKFEHRLTGLEGDISLYNLLAQRNTLMLSCYANVDERCRILGYVMKAFVKRCHIGDASRGSLSSYAYTLMVIFFLQQREPAVLPVLQQLDTDGTKTNKVDGWNSWFYEDIENLEKVWPDKGKNAESVGELWLAMIRFYTEEFDFKKHVICIRQKKLLTTFEKEWTSKFISIEDPFDLNHNLGAGVSRKMTNFIMRVFIKARQHFSQLPEARIAPLREVNYFFDAKVLMDGEEAPNDRCCRICGKIGHFVRTCPKSKRRRKEGDDENDPVNDVKCFYCSEVGHIKKNCPLLKEDIMKGQPRRQTSVESPNKMGSRPIPINRNSPMGRPPHTPGRYENGWSPSYSHMGNQSPAEKFGKANKRLALDQSPSTPTRDQANRNPRIRKNSSGSAPSGGQQSPGYRFDEGNEEGKSPGAHRYVPARAKQSGKWHPLASQLQISMPHQGGQSPRSPGSEGPGAAHMRPAGPVGSPQDMTTLSQIESQIFQASPRDVERKTHEHGNSEPPSPRVRAITTPTQMAPIPAAPVFGFGVRQPPSPQGYFSPPIQPPPPFSPYRNPEMSPQTPPFPFYGCSPGGSPWNGPYRGGS